MTRTILTVAALLIPTMLTAPGWAVEPKGPSESPPKKHSDQQVREREGGQPMATERMRQGRQEGTEEGLPKAKIESFDRRERFQPEPRWRLGVYAYNTETGVVITRVIPGSPAWRLGFEPGDRIVTVGGFQVGFVGNRVFCLGEELQLRADPQGRVQLLAQNVRDDGLLNLDIRLESRRHREPPFPLPRERPEGPRSER